jgi:hypothetical protein
MILAGLSTTLGILDSAASLLVKSKPAYDKAKSLGGSALRFKDKLDSSSRSLTSITQQTTMLSRVYIDDVLLQENVLPNVLRSTHEWYAAQILAALKLSHLITDKQTVQDIMTPLQTGHSVNVNNLMNGVAKRALGVESFRAAYLGEGATESFDPADPLVLITKQDAEDMARRERESHERTQKAGDAMKAARDQAEKNEEDAARNAAKPNEAQVRSVAASEHRLGPMGELFEVTMTNPSGNGQSVTVPIFVQMQPYLIAHDIAPRFVDMNVSPTIWQRWTQYTAGEISFLKDFIGGLDLIKRQAAISKDPAKAAAFNDFLHTVAKKDHYALAELHDKNAVTRSANLANTVIILSEDTVRQARVDSAIDLHKPADRQRYFRDTYSMMLIVLDTLHQHVTIYFNGIDGSIEVSYNEFRPKDSKFDPKDFLTALQAFSTNSLGRLR